MALIIFDFDGVIADCLHYIHKIINILADKHGFRRIDSDEHFSDLINGNLLQMIDRLGIPKHLLPIIYLEYKEMMKKELPKMHIYKGMDEVIKTLAEHHILVIISSNHKDIIEDFLDHHGLRECFRQIMGAEFSFHKEHKLKHIIKELDSKKSYFITDTLGDVRDAKVVEGLKTIGVSWGYHTWSKKDDISPDMLVKSPEELVKVLTQ